MFAQAASGKMSPCEALSRTNAEVVRVFRKWQAQGKA